MDFCQGRKRISDQQAVQFNVVPGFFPPAPYPSEKHYLIILSILSILVK